MSRFQHNQKYKFAKLNYINMQKNKYSKNILTKAVSYLILI